MSRYIATRAIRGANALVTEAETMLHRALGEKGPETPVARSLSPGTAALRRCHTSMRCLSLWRREGGSNCELSIVNCE